MKSNKTLLTIAILAVCLVSIGFVGAVSADDTTTPTPTATATPTPTPKSSDISLTISGIIKPVSGELPTTTKPTVSSNPSGVITSISDITWKLAGDALSVNTNFGYGNVYTAEFTVTIDDSIDIGIVTLITPTGASKTEIPRVKNNVITIDVVYPETVSETDISSVSANVTAPATGEYPSTSVTLAGSTYSVSSVKWYKDGSTTAMNTTDKFETNTKYKVTIVLKPVTGYIFNSSLAKTNAKINGNEPSAFTRDSNTKVTMSYVFPVMPNSLCLLKGWNFISVPKKLSADNDTAGELFSGVDTAGHPVLMYNADTKAWEQASASTKISPLNAYWIYSVSEKTLPYAFDTTPSLLPTKTVYEGWNAVGLSAEEAMEAEAAFGNTDWYSFVAWNSGKQKYYSPIIRGNTGTYAETTLVSPWVGGWLYVNSDGTYLGYA